MSRAFWPKKTKTLRRHVRLPCFGAMKHLRRTSSVIYSFPQHSTAANIMAQSIAKKSEALPSELIQKWRFAPAAPAEVKLPETKKKTRKSRAIPGADAMLGHWKFNPRSGSFIADTQRKDSNSDSDIGRCSPPSSPISPSVFISPTLTTSMSNDELSAHAQEHERSYIYQPAITHDFTIPSFKACTDSTSDAQKRDRSDLEERVAVGRKRRAAPSSASSSAESREALWLSFLQQSALDRADTTSSPSTTNYSQPVTNGATHSGSEHMTLASTSMPASLQRIAIENLL